MADPYTLDPAVLPDVLAAPEFTALPFAKRQQVLEMNLQGAANYVQSNGGWTPQTWQDFGELSSALRQRVQESETLGEKVRYAGGVALRTLKDTLAITGTTALGASPMLPSGEMQVPLQTTGPALGLNVMRGVEAVRQIANRDQRQPLEAAVGELKRQIDAGDFLGDPQGWMDKRADTLNELQAQWYGEDPATTNGSWAQENHLLANPDNAALLGSYLRTRDPLVWQQLETRLYTTPQQARNAFQLDQLQNQTALGRALAPEARPLISEAADPFELAGSFYAVIKGAKALERGASAATRLRTAAAGVAGEVASEQGSLTLDQPLADFATRKQVAKDTLIGALGLAGAGAGAQALINRALPPSQSPNDLPPPQQTPAPTPAPATDPSAAPVSPVAGTPAGTPLTPLTDIAARGGRIDPTLPEDTGELTAEEVQDLETGRRQPILQDVPDQVPSSRFQVPSAQTLPPAANPDPAQTITGSNVQTGTEMPVPPPTAEAGAGAGAVGDGQPNASVTKDSGPTADQTAQVSDPGAGLSPAAGASPSTTETSGISLLRQLNAELPPEAQARWTPEVYAKSERYMQTGNEADLEGLTPIQRKRVINARIDADPDLRKAQEQWDRKMEHKASSIDKRDRAFEQNTTFKPRESEQSRDDAPGFRHLVIDRDLEAGFMSGAGVDALIDLAHRAFAAGRTFAQWAAAMVQRFGAAVRDYLAGVWDHAKRSSQTGALNFTSRLGEQLQQASQQAASRLRNPASRATTAGMASDPGAAQNAEPSPGGLTEAEAPAWPYHGKTDWTGKSVPEEVVIYRANTYDRGTFWSSSPDFVRSFSKNHDDAPIRTAQVRFSKVLDLTGVGLSPGDFIQRLEDQGVNVDEPILYDPRYPAKSARQMSEHLTEDDPDRIFEIVDRAGPHWNNQGWQAVKFYETYDGHAGRTYHVSPDFFNPESSRAAAGTSPSLPLSPSSALPTAYASALRGSSTAMVPLADVFAAAQAANPTLTQEQFQAQVMSDYEAGSLMLEGAGSQQEAQSAGLRIDGTPVGTAVRMMVPQGFKNLNTSGRTAGFLNTDILAEATDLIRNGITDFANWSRAMVQRFGAAIREFLAGMWQQITSPQTNAAQNVRMGMAQGTAPVTLGQGGFVNGPQQPTPNETQSRFASPNPADRVINGPRTDELVTAEANAWLNSMDQQAAVEAFVAGQVPLSLDTAERAAATLIANLSEQAATAKTEMARMWAHVQSRRMARVWTTEHLSADPARALRQRGVVNNTILAPIAPVLAAQELLEDRAKKVIDQRFDGGTEGAVAKVKDIATKADEQAGTELAADLEGETTPGAPTRPGQPPRPRKLGAKHPNLKKMLDALRKKMFPGMSWADIFTQLPESQKERQREIYRRLMLDERLRNLTAEERLALTNELDKAWQRERRKVFMRELEKADVLGEAKPKDREKVKAAAPRLLRLMNLGMLNSDLFREALAQEYGVRQITPAIAAELRALGERIQTAPEGLPRRKLEQQLVEKLQSLVDATLWQTIDSYWTASVLSGWRTQVDIGLSLANGIEDVGLGSVVTAIRTGNKDVAVRALGALFGRIPSAFLEAVDHIATGNKSMMRNFELEAKQAMEGGNRLASDVGAAMWKRGGWRKVPGAFMVFYGRLLTALDHINSASTREGALAMALARHPELYQRALRITPADRAAARKQARQELTLGTAPATRQQRLEEDARVREILEQGTPPELLDEALEVGRRAALQGEPTGIGGTLLDAVLSAVDVVNRKATELAGRENADAITKQGAKVTGALVPFVRALTGTKFARTVAHAMNRNLSYVPGVGFYAVGQQGRTGAFADILMARQIIGTLVGIAAYLAFDDDEDEKGIEDGWKDKTPQQKAQLYAQGKQPFTVWGRDAQGRVVSYNYQQWGIAGILNTVAAMLKQKDSEAGTMNVLTNSLIQGAMSFTDKAQLQGLQTVFGDNYRSTDPASGIASNLNKWAAQTVGGLVPRIAKDIDNQFSPELRDSSQWWQRWVKEVPMVRELSSGKRVNILGEDIKLDRSPLSRVRQVGTADPAYRTLGLLNSRDIYLPDPSTGVRIVGLADGTRRPMTPQEKDRYQRLTGAAYRQLLNEKGTQILQMDPEDAKDYILKTTKRLRDRAAVQAVK